MPDTTTIAAQRQSGQERLKPHALRPTKDIEALLTDLLGMSRAQLFSRSERTLTVAQIASLDRSLQRLEQGEPIAYVRGQEEFWSLSLNVTPSVLIPRPDTERLVELALERLSSLPTARVLELGTGSGAIALALASERPQDSIVATDISPEAIEVAYTNYQRLTKRNPHVADVSLLVSNWYQQLDQTPFDLIVSNPPYIDPADPHIESSVKQHEPSIALFAKNEGMAAIQHIVANAAAHMKPGGSLMLEHGWQQHSSVEQCFQEHGFTEIKSHQDLAGHYRVTEANYIGPITMEKNETHTMKINQ